MAIYTTPTQAHSAGKADTMSTTTIPQLVDVSVAFEPANDMHSGFWAVHPIWSGVDRADTGGWGIGNEKLARRLERAIRAGAVCTNPTIVVDNFGSTYVSHDGHRKVMAKYCNADLKKLGY